MGKSTYAENILKKYGIEEAKAISTPLDSGIKLIKATPDSELCDATIYQSAVGSLIYLATKTCPDISFPVNNVARFCSKPTKTHWTAVKHLFRYLRGTTNYGLLYEKTS